MEVTNESSTLLLMGGEFAFRLTNETRPAVEVAVAECIIHCFTLCPCHCEQVGLPWGRCRDWRPTQGLVCCQLIIQARNISICFPHASYSLQHKTQGCSPRPVKRPRMSTHSVMSPAIYYWGTPMFLITTTNEDNTPNIGPMSSAFWLGNRCMLGLKSDSQTTINLLRTKQCVLNLPSDDMAARVNALARTTGSQVVPDFKVSTGYRYEKDKFGAARLTSQKSELVRPPRILECPAQMEAKMAGVHEMMSSLPGEAKGFTLAIEVRILRSHVVDALRLRGHDNRIDPDAWQPMIMSFQHLYGLSRGSWRCLLSPASKRNCIVFLLRNEVADIIDVVHL
jgi:flavin reductase (DIM6/NTAB) family NADH-FMN oxidoreductase RutF